MSDTCPTHRSRVPQRSSERIKGGATTVEDERGPGLDFLFVFCVRQSSVRGCHFLLCLFILLLKHFKHSPIPFFLIYKLCYIGAETREERGTRCQRALAAGGIAVLRRSGSRKKQRPPVAARGGGAGAIEEQVGRKTRCCAPRSRRGGCRLRGSGGVSAVRREARACCRPPCLGRSRERGTRCRLPSTAGAIAVHQEAEEHLAVHQRCPVPSHGTASESLSAVWRPNCSVSGNRTTILFFPLSHLSSLSLLILTSPFLSPRLTTRIKGGATTVGLETGEWCRCRSLSFTPPVSLRSHGSRSRPTCHKHKQTCLYLDRVNTLEYEYVTKYLYFK